MWYFLLIMIVPKENVIAVHVIFVVLALSGYDDGNFDCQKCRNRKRCTLEIMDCIVPLQQLKVN